jgi:hypothetical protein
MRHRASSVVVRCDRTDFSTSLIAIVTVRTMGADRHGCTGRHRIAGAGSLASVLVDVETRLRLV